MKKFSVVDDAEKSQNKTEIILTEEKMNMERTIRYPNLYRVYSTDNGLERATANKDNAEDYYEWLKSYYSCSNDEVLLDIIYSKEPEYRC